MALPDIVVPVREGAANQQLRYALRSWVANVPHRRVWVVGYKPAWLTGVEHIRTHQAGKTKYQNTTQAVRVACEHPEVSSKFLLCNDDFFVMRPQPAAFPVFHRGPVSLVEKYYAGRGHGKYLKGLRETRDLLVKLGHENPASYELHVPLPVQKAGMLRALEMGKGLEVVHKRTLYGCLSRLGGTRMRDVKVLNRAPRDFTTQAFLSTMPDSFTNGAVGRYIRAAFREPCRYETRTRVRSR